MFDRTIETAAAVRITVTECLGDLAVRGAEEPGVRVRARDGEDDVLLEQKGDDLTLAVRSDCSLTCPVGTTLTVQIVRGDLRVRGVDSQVTVGTVHGDVSLRDAGPATLEQVYGDLSARRVSGDLQVGVVMGDALLRIVDGACTLHEVGGDLVAEGLAGGLDAEKVGGDARLGPPFSPASTYRFHVGSDLSVIIPADASLRLSLRAGSAIHSRIPDLVLEDDGAEAAGVLGEGEAILEAEAGSAIHLRPAQSGHVPSDDLEFDLGGLGLDIEARITEAMAELESRLEESLGRIDSEALRLRVGRAVERSHQAAERAAERARQAAEREAERARLRRERAERRWRRVSGQKTTPREPAASDEERLRVLRMLEKGIITPQQATELLAALEGR